MRNRTTLLILLLVLCHGVTVTMGFWRTSGEDIREEDVPSSRQQDKMFMMENYKRVIKTDAGEMRVLESTGGKILERRLHIGFITMEPSSLFIPQYLDSSFIIFLREGKAKVGLMYKGKMRERRLKMGDLYRIPAGSAFYLVNTEEVQKLHIICSFDPSESIGVGIFQPFYIGGGANALSILSGFEHEILETAFNTTGAELKKIFTSQHEGPIVHVNDSSHASSSAWTQFLELEEEEKLQHMKKMVQEREVVVFDEEEEKETTWSWRKLLESVIGGEIKNKRRNYIRKAPHSYNLYDREPDFKNSYGWSVALDGSEYSPLKRSGVGVYHVKLAPGSMMAPHLNPRATEYGIVLNGTGKLQIVFPNGTNAMDTHIRKGDVFFVPRYFPFCQIASREGPLEFFGFTTSAKKNKPQFLVGATSLIRRMMGPELAASFGVSEDTMRQIVNAQHEAVILPTPWDEHN